MVVIKLNQFEIEKVYGGYLLFISSPNETQRHFLGKFTKEELHNLAKELLNITN